MPLMWARPGPTRRVYRPTSAAPATPAAPPSDSTPVRVVPKGLRSFDAHDADFFLELLPGPRDRDGLPDSIRFWKARIEETDADGTFASGLLYARAGGEAFLLMAALCLLALPICAGLRVPSDPAAA